MLNISRVPVGDRIDRSKYVSFTTILSFKTKKLVARVIYSLLIIFIIFMFLPWTQNIRSKGSLTALKPEDRPQTIHATIAGRIERWYVQEGEYVKKGDTIVFLSEVKSEYFDPNLIGRTEEQLASKKATIQSYTEKMSALDQQVAALQENLRLKMDQARNKIRQSLLKIQSDSIEYVLAVKDNSIATDQVNRAKDMYSKGVISLTDYERRQMKLQETGTKLISSENKLLASRNDLLNARIDLNNLQNEYTEKISKSRSDRFSAESDLYDAVGTVAKMENQYSNYALRAGFYHIIAPQDGYIVKALKPGIGEIVKEGEAIVSIMPADAVLAAEIYVKPMDLPLLDTGQTVRLIFDGWPAFMFSGWAGMSFGTFGGKIVAIDRFPTSGYQYRVLIAPDKTDNKPWPTALRAGSGVSGNILLKDVPIWYEIWRQINGFPPEFYDETPKETPKTKDKK